MHHPTVHITSNTTACGIVSLALTVPFLLLHCSFAFLHNCNYTTPTPHRSCFEALARALRFRAAYYCRGLRAPLHHPGIGQSILVLELHLVAFGIAFWSCLVLPTARSHSLFGQIDHTGNRAAQLTTWSSRLRHHRPPHAHQSLSVKGSPASR
jgi:hypothetical protein